MGKAKTKSLFRLVKDKYLKKELTAYLDLVSDPRFVYLKCGGIANLK